MAGPASTTSSMTSTSHTLTHAPSVGFLSSFADSSKPSSAMEILQLFEAVKPGNRHSFLQPAASLPNASLQLAKSTLDAYAGQVCDEQQQRQREESKKRKRAENVPAKGEVLKIRKLHVDGFESGQVWQQAKRIITSTLQDSKGALQALQDLDHIQVNGINGHAHADIIEQNEDVSEVASDSDELASGLDETERYVEDDDDDEDESLEEGLNGTELLDDEAEEDFEDDGEEVTNEDDKDQSEEASGEEELVEDPDGLNDGFFSIDNFNKQTQWFEKADARADPDADAASDDDEVDWHADPLAERTSTNGKATKKSTKGVEDDIPFDMEDDDEDEEDEDGGPTFGDMDLDAPEGQSEDDEEDIDMDGGDEFNANEVYYKDFFAPPQRKGAKGNRPKKSRGPQRNAPDDNDMERAMADVRRDLFEDESERDDSENALSDVSAGDPKSRRSAHERRQAKLAEEIRKLEAANVAKREWTMSGEAKAADRPMNSLLEEDLDFEHVGKPVPVITAEVSESIEEMIKRRILAQEFDEVIKRRPDASEFSSTTRRGLVDLDDSKAKQSLAEIYEEEHVKNTNPDSYVSKADEKLRKEEKEIEQMWKEVSANLDALTSWHYKPKPAAPSLTVVSDVATISMEDAQPTTAQGVTGGDTALAPQEIYKAGKDTAEKGELVAKSGLPVAKQEMSREDKIRKRRQEKERTRKAGGVGGQKPESAKAQAQKQTLGDLKLGGVKVINKKGEVVDMQGNKARATKAASSSNFKL
ncbi:Mpp10 protein [Hypoxylon sp. FL1284]|nr:Mpp10 protein [Hypoxylon sp. FL1284]